MKIDITKRKQLNILLNNLKEDTPAGWGLMKPQNVVEHLAKTLQCSNGKKQLAQRSSEHEGNLAKQAFIYTDLEMSKGIKSPLAGELPDPFKFSSLDEAKRNLNNELDDFESYFDGNPNATFIQPRLGKLNNREWIIFHNKHFTHHFKQFGLI